MIDKMRNQTFDIKKALMSVFVVVSLSISMIASVGTSAALAQVNNDPTKVDIELEVDAPSADIRLGEEHDRVYEIKNIEDAAYIRLIPTLKFNGEDIDKLELDLGADWIKAADGYYYYTLPLDQEGHQDLDAKILFEGNEPYIVKMNSGDKISLIETVTAEAIQAKDMYPDFSADEPWKDAYKGPYEPSVDTENKNVTSGSGLQQTGDRTDLMSWLILGGIAFLILMIAETRIKFAYILKERKEK